METFNKCLQTLRQSKSDNEKLAALMVISKITHTLDVNKSLTEDLYKAVSCTFLLRLLKTSPKKDDSTEMFHQLALNVLTAVAKVNPSVIVGDEEIVKQLLEMLRNFPGNETAIVELLTLLCSDKEGCKILVGMGVLNETVCYFLKPDLVETTEILYNTILSTSGTSLDKHLAALIVDHSEVLVNNQDIEKFQELELLAKLLKLMYANCYNVDGFSQEHKTKLLKNICMAIQDLLKARIKAIYKQKIISMVSSVIHLFGLDLTFEATSEKSTFCVLLLTVASVELACLFNLETPADTLEQYSDFIVGSFSICKSVLIYICSDSFEDDELACDSKFIVNVFNSFKNIMSSTYCFLQSTEHENLDNPILVEALTMVCVWATEETESLQDELKAVLPLLMKVARHCIDHDNNKDLFTSMAPCIAQLLPDDAIQKVLISNQCLPIIQDYTLQIMSKKSEINNVLECLIHIFHEMIILSPKHCKSVIWTSNLIDLLAQLYAQCKEERGLLSLYSRYELLAVLLRLSSLCQVELPLDTLLPNAFELLSLISADLEDMDEAFNNIWHVAMQAFIEVVSSHDSERSKLKENDNVKRILSDNDELSSGDVKMLIERFGEVLCT